MTETELSAFVRRLPKAELHVHIEGTLEPELMIELAARHQVELPFADVGAVRAAYAFSDLQSFLDVYYEGASLLRTEQDFFDLMAAYLHRARADGVRRAEVFFDPQTHSERGVAFETFMGGFTRAIDEVASELDLSVGLIMCFLRHLGGAAACETFEQAGDHHDLLLGVGLDSTELGHPPDDFADAFGMAADAGLHRVAHAGEEGPPEYVVGALDVLGVERIDHGVQCERDPALVARLASSGVPLTVCPLSNVALRVFDRLEDHNLKRLMDQGVVVTVNSDDPAYFGGYVADNYVAVAAALDLSDTDLTNLARNSFEASFADRADKDRWLAEVADVVEGSGR